MTNELLKLVANSPAGVTAVGSGDLLGCVIAIIPSWVFGVMGLCCLFSLYQCVRVLVEIHGENKERKRQRNQSPCENHQSLADLLCSLGSDVKNSGNLGADKGKMNNLLGKRRLVSPLGHLGKLRHYCGYLISKIALCFHKSKDVAKQPNADISHSRD
jgi:hypothetical protein